MQFETKVAVVLRNDLAAWQAINVTAFLISGIAGTTSEIVGPPFEPAIAVALLKELATRLRSLQASF